MSRPLVSRIFNQGQPNQDGDCATVKNNFNFSIQNPWSNGFLVGSNSVPVTSLLETEFNSYAGAAVMQLHIIKWESSKWENELYLYSLNLVLNRNTVTVNFQMKVKITSMEAHQLVKEHIRFNLVLPLDYLVMEYDDSVSRC